MRDSAPLESVPSEVVRAAQRGDPIAMAELMDVLAPFVGRICGPIALDQGPDAAQEALIQIFRDLRQLRDPAALRGWARRIATREAVRHAQRARRESGVEAGVQSRFDSGGIDLPAPDDPALAADVRGVLARLGPEQRAILVLRHVDGLSEEEAAAELRVARGTVKSRLHRARAAFARRWAE